MFRRFVEYVQLPAKSACVLPFFLALFYTAFAYHQISVRNTVLFFISMFFFEMSVTGLNNYIDSKSTGAQLPFSKKTSRRILYLFWAVAGVSAIMLVAYTGLIVLAAGALCFFVGIFYTFGPAPLSHMPLGEIFSGAFEGFFIPFLVTFINAPAGSLIEYTFHGWVLDISFQIAGLFRIALLTLPAMMGIADIMLANNICDLDEDIKVRRHTLPYYLGVRNALRLFALLYYLAYAAIVAVAAFSVLPPYVLVSLVTVFGVRRNIRVFRNHQSKQETFPLSVWNFFLVVLPLIAVEATALVL